jgi:hypothetical protein
LLKEDELGQEEILGMINEGVSGIIAQLDGPASKMLEDGMNLFNQNYKQKELQG